MNPQLKKGLAEICVLAVLKRGDSYGYKLSSEIKEIMDISESALYPILRRLETAGYIGVYSREFNGRLRRYYSIKDEGVAKIADFIGEWRDVMKVYNYINGGTENE